eukprot:1206346-Pleurochrysis_carterae.AAC.1
MSTFARVAVDAPCAGSMRTGKDSMVQTGNSCERGQSFGTQVPENASDPPLYQDDGGALQQCFQNNGAILSAEQLVTLRFAIESQTASPARHDCTRVLTTLVRDCWPIDTCASRCV